MTGRGTPPGAGSGEREAGARACPRCPDARLDRLPESDGEIAFFACPSCGRRYAREADGQLTARWPHPVALVLYTVLFEERPVSRAGEIADRFRRQRPPDELSDMIREIERELEEPTQEVRAILDNPLPEEECRAFLRAFVRELRDRLP